MAESGAIRAGRAFVEMALDGKGLDAGLRAAERRLKAWAAGISKVGGFLSMGFGSSLGKTLLLGGGLLGSSGGIVEAAKHFSDTGNAMAKMSQRTGIAVEELSALKFAADEAGMTIEELEIGIKKMQKGGFGSGLDALENFADKMASLQDPMQRTQLAVEVFGRSGTMLLPMLLKGKEGIREMAKEAKGAGLIMSADTAAKAEKLHHAIRVLEMQIGAVTNAVGSALAPALVRMGEKITPILRDTIAWVKANDGLVVSVAQFAALAVALGTVQIALGFGVMALGKFVSLGAVGIKLLVSAVGALTSPLGIVAAAVAGIGAAWLLFTDSGTRAAESIGKAWLDSGETFGRTWKGITDALSSGQLALAGQVAWAGLKVVWFQGIDLLKATWADFATDLSRSFDGAFDVVSSRWRTFAADVRRSQSAISFGLASFAVVGGMSTGLVGFQDGMAMMRDLRRQLRDEQRGITNDTNKANAAALGEQNRRPGGEVGPTRAILESGQQLQDARDQLNSLLAVSDFNRMNAARDEVKKGANPFAASGGESIGTFSSAGALAIGAGAGSPFQRLQDEQRKSREALEKVVDILQSGATLVFT